MTLQYSPLRINPDISAELRILERGEMSSADARESLGALLQSALELEFSTVPPYLSAAFSIGNENEELYRLILRIAKEEMLHMTAVANLMNAVGIPPNIIRAIPDYPYDLDVLEPPLHLDLTSFSFELVKDLFMQIETPEEPVDFTLAFDDGSVETIGQFYEKIIQIIEKDTIPSLFDNAEATKYKQIKVDPNFQPVHYKNNSDTHRYPLKPDIDFVITDKKSAVRHLEWIVAEGEGASEFDPLSAEGIPGHYYRFESILEGAYLVKDGSASLGFSYSGGDLPFDESDVTKFLVNAKASDFEETSSGIKRRMDKFNQSYTQMVDRLSFAFKCPSPDKEDDSKQAYQDSLKDMSDLRRYASAIVRRSKEEDIEAGIPFEYLGERPLAPVTG